MNYLSFQITCQLDFVDILVAELSEVGFDSFLETDTGLDAYVEESLFDRATYQEVIDRYEEIASIIVTEGVLEKKNWNEEWEKSYDPIIVSEKVLIRASFHKPQPAYPYEILINPKMSFGTGHHATTHLMIEHQLEIDHQGKRVLDIGCGTGILAIMARKLGATDIEAFDMDEWSVENSHENFLLNEMPDIKLAQGIVTTVNPTGAFDILIANINKNVLLNEMEAYVKLAKEGTYLLLSGFYETDIPQVQAEAEACGFTLDQSKVRNDWAALRLIKG
ncbi:50S ribosomal protein L11 methyltransferase [Penaeicola halotolerans]|uniref:50S ribosomal protein L11 methyltransferase n=1 Tax=Penaeicola halotolerans TaxID=2793196 RepID=UPI001CF876F3|nr:50S ribosomal protein L11 methyltransferase [Penaeicola halotolerans]